MYLNMNQINIATFNVNGIRDGLKRRKNFNHLHDEGYDFVLLQETHSTEPIEKYWASEWGGRIIFDHGTSEARVCAILLKKGTQIHMHDVVRSTIGRYIMIKFAINGKDNMVICNLYAPNTDTPEFFQEVMSKIECTRSDYHIIGGDFNTVMHGRDVKGGRGHTHRACTEYLQEYSRDQKLVDIWRLRNEDTFRYTWTRKKPHLIMERLDFFLISFALQQWVNDTDIRPSYLSDHSIPTLWLSLDNPLARGKGRWMFNTTLMDDENFDSDIKQIIRETSENIKDAIMRWEIIKMTVRGNAIKMGTRKAKSTRLKIAALEKKLYDIEVKQAADMNTKLFTEESDERQKILINKELDEIREYKTRGAMMRSRSEWVELGEKVNKRFFQLEKAKGKRKAINKLESEKGEVMDTNDGIMLEIYEFYEQLYKYRETDDITEYLKELAIPQVKPEDQMMLNSPILMDEIEIAIKQLAKDKCPGPDGFQMNLMQKYYPQLKYILHAAYMQVDETNEMIPSAREGVVALMEKLNKNSLKLANWRPLVMLCSDYKVFAKIIANRLQSVLPYLISPEQVGFMKGRGAADNLIDLLTVIEHCEQNDIAAIITSVDYKKAFDTISWSATQAILRSFGFADRFIHLVMLCYKDFQVSISNNGHQTERIDIQRGNKQGCPLSTLTFLLVIEIVGLKLKQNKDIQCIEIEGIKKLLSQYADDLWTITKYNKKSFNAQLAVFNEFEKVTGLCINYNKTEILRLGNLAKTDAKIYSRFPLVWSDGPVRILGLDATASLKEIININFERILNKIEGIYNL